MKPTGSSHHRSTASSSSRREMYRHYRGVILRVGIGTLLAVMGPVGALLATSDSWDGSTDALWSTTTNWLTDPAVVPGTGDTAIFDNAGNGFTTIDLGAGVTISTILFDTASAAAYTIGDANDVLTFNTAGGITINSGVTTAQQIGVAGTTINLSNAAAASTTFTNNGTGLLTIAGNVAAQNASGAGVLNVVGTGHITITGTVTEPGVGNQALKKVGTGTLTLSNGSSWSGLGASQPLGGGAGGNSSFAAPVIVQEGTLLLNGGTHTVNGEVIIGGISGAHGGAGQNAKVQVDAGALNITTWLSIGRGNGNGTATSDLTLNNNAVVTAVNMGAGFNAGNAANVPKGTITLNGTSSLSVSNIVNIAESAGSNFTVNVNDTSTFQQTANANETRVGGADGAVGVINVNGGTASFHRDFILGGGGTGSGKLVLTSGTVNAATTVERWLKLNDSGSGSTGRIDVDGGNLNLNTNTDLRFSTNANASGTNVVNLNGGAITGHTGNNNGVFSATSVVDLNQGSNNAAVSNTFNLNGGTLTIGQIISSNNAGIAAFNFNGGTLRAAAASGAFLDLGGANQRANVRDGGAIINTDGKDVTVVQALLHSNILTNNPVTGTPDAAIDGGLTKNGAGILTLAGANTYTGTTTINAGTVNFTGTATYTGGITGAGAVTVNGGITSFGGASSYLGTTSVNAGTLSFLNTAAKPATAVTVSAAAGLGLGVGGAGFFSSADVDSLFTNTMAGVTMDATSLVGIDTTAGDFTYATSQAGTNGLIKLGTNTLVLSGTNSYTGATTIGAGTLEYQSATAMSSSSTLAIASGGTLSLRADADTTFTPASITGPAGSYTISVDEITGAGAGKTLTLANSYNTGASGNSLTVSSTSGDTLRLSSQLLLGGASSTINLSGADMTLNAGVNFNNNAGGPLLTVNANSNTLLINGNYTTGNNRWAGIVVNNGTLTMANGQAGGLSTNNGVYAVLNGGTLNLNNANAIGGANAGNNFAINGGTLDNTSGSTKTLTRNPVTTINGNFAFSTSGGTSANDLSLGTGAKSLGTAAGATRTITTNGSATLTVGGVITSNGATPNHITKAGTGTLALTGNSATTYLGATTVDAGTLLVSGSISGSTTTVNNTGTLGGAGGTTGAVTVNIGGTLSPGASIGTLNTTGNVTLNAGATFKLEINTTAATTDLHAITGNLSLAGTNDVVLTITDLTPAAFASGSLTFMTYTPGGWNGGLFTYNSNVIADGGLLFVGANQFTLDYDFGGNSVVLIAVPEPGSAVSLLGGLGLLFGVQRFRRRARA